MVLPYLFLRFNTHCFINTFNAHQCSFYIHQAVYEHHCAFQNPTPILESRSEFTKGHGPGGNPTPADQQDYNVTTHAHQWQQSVSYCYSMLYFHIHFSKLQTVFFIPPISKCFLATDRCLIFYSNATIKSR